MLFNVRLPTIFETLSLLSILSPFANASSFPNQPNPFTGVTLSSDGAIGVVCTSNQWFFRNTGTDRSWNLGTVATGLSGVVEVAMDTTGGQITFAGNDGFRAYSSDTVLTKDALPTLVTTSSSNVNSLSMNKKAADSLQAMGTLDGGIWISTGAAASFSKYVRIGANTGAGENFVPIGGVSVQDATTIALGVTYTGNFGRGYTTATAGGDFAAMTALPAAVGVLTSLCASTAAIWYASFRATADGSTSGVFKTANTGASWSAVLNNTVFPTAQHVASASDTGKYLVVCANDQVFISADIGVSFQVEFPHFDQALQSWSNIMPETPLKSAISYDGLEIVVITRLSIYSASCTYTKNNASCDWDVVSIQTSTATYLAQEGSNISGKSGDVHYNSNNGGLSWNVKLQSGDAQKSLL